MTEYEICAETPRDSLEVFDRWWQLETWLRDVLEYEALALHGSGWRPRQRDKAEGWMDADSVNAYMASADADSWLRYVSSSHLGKLLDQSWVAVADWLLPEARWKAAFEMAIQIRDRTMHCRRPHEDDAVKLHLLLRDLDVGAVAFWRSFESRMNMSARRDPHPLVDAWVRRKHPDAARLVQHVSEKDHVTLRIDLNQRPWAEVEDPETFTVPEPSTPGWLWVVSWTIGKGALQPAAFWEHLSGWGTDLTDRLVFINQSSPADLQVAFSNVDDPADTADAIGKVFDALLDEAPAHRGDRGYWDDKEAWLDGVDRLPARYQLEGPIVNGLSPSQRRYFNVHNS